MLIQYLSHVMSIWTPFHHCLREETIFDCGVFKLFELFCPFSKKVFDGADVARRDLGGIEMEGISDKQAEFWSNGLMFAISHSKRPDNRIKLRKHCHIRRTNRRYNFRTSFWSPDFAIDMVVDESFCWFWDLRDWTKQQHNLNFNFNLNSTFHCSTTFTKY